MRDDLEVSLVLKFTREGELIPFSQIMHQAYIRSKTSKKPIAILIGGFQKGYYSKEIQKIPGSEISISPHGMDSWIIINRVITLYEYYSGLLD